MAKRKSTKQLLDEREQSRRKKKKEAEAEYYERKKDYEASGLESLFPLRPRENFVKRKVDEWERKQQIILRDRYQDPEELISIYQQKFVDFFRQLNPKVNEELTELVTHFDTLVGENKSEYHSFFNWDTNRLHDVIFKVINHIQYSSSLSTCLDFDSGKYGNLKKDYRWGHLRLLLQYLHLKFTPPDKIPTKFRQNTAEQLYDSLVINRNFPDLPDDIDELRLSESKRITDDFINDRENCLFSRQEISNLVREFPSDGELNIRSFTALNLELLEWAERHSLEKDWLLRYAYSFLHQFSENPNLEASNLDVFYLRLYEYQFPFEFEFKFKGWSPFGSREAYEKELRESFELKLVEHFQEVALEFRLDEKKIHTKPKDPDFESIKWLIAWNEGATMKEIGDFFGRSFETIRDGIAELTKFHLPRRMGKRGRKKHRLVPKERLAEIKKIK